MTETNYSLLDLVNDEIYNNEDEAPSVFQCSPYYSNEGLQEIFSNVPNTFKIISLNVQSLNAKFNELKIYIEAICKSDFSAVCIQETWLSDESDLSLLQLNGYNLISKGKSSSQHGGVAIYLKEDFRYKILPICSHSNIWDGIFLEIDLNESLNQCSNKTVIIGNIYRPPRDNIENYNTFVSELDQILHNLQQNNKDVAITGDFNIDLLKIKERNIFNDYFESMLANGFIPKITYPTRITYHSKTP